MINFQWSMAIEKDNNFDLRLTLIIDN